MELATLESEGMIISNSKKRSVLFMVFKFHSFNSKMIKNLGFMTSR